MSSRRIFAIIPAAGRSRRMRAPKLLLPWNDATIMDCVLRAWCESNVRHVIVVQRQGDEALASICANWPVEIVRPDRHPRDMKESIQYGLQHISEVHAPQGLDQWMVAPADLPELNSELINQLVAHAERRHCVVAPRFGDRQGHPVLFPWALSEKVFTLAADQGLNRLLEDQAISFVDFPAKERVIDVDTPEEYDRLKDA